MTRPWRSPIERGVHVIDLPEGENMKVHLLELARVIEKHLANPADFTAWHNTTRVLKMDISG